MNKAIENIPDGVWPTMLTPFSASGEINFEALEKLVEWYLSKDVDGLFAVCQSSEMFHLTLKQRVDLAQNVIEYARGRVPVIASGHISDTLEGQIEEIKRISNTGINAFVIVTNRFAASKESDEVWKKNAEIILNQVSDINFGLYECPSPYKRLMTPDLLKWCASTGRFVFIKDTSCNLDQIKEKLDAVKGTQLKLYNAHTDTVLDSLKLGAAGFSGIMSNFHPELYVWLAKNWAQQPDKAIELQTYLSNYSNSIGDGYPVSAKYNLELNGIPMGLKSHLYDSTDFLKSDQLRLEQVKVRCDEYSRRLIDVYREG